MKEELAHKQGVTYGTGLLTRTLMGRGVGGSVGLLGRANKLPLAVVAMTSSEPNQHMSCMAVVLGWLGLRSGSNHLAFQDRGSSGPSQLRSSRPTLHDNNAVQTGPRAG